jgi:RHS repeat-associated protein
MPKTKYIWDGDNILYETDGNDAVIAQYTYSPEQYGHLISEFRDGTTYTHYYDSQGSTVAMTDETGHVTDTFVYNSWGGEVGRTGSTETPWRWIGSVGYYFDIDLDHHFVRRRSYLSALARWSSIDPCWPMSYGGLYLYASNRPVSFIDPTGCLVLFLDDEGIPCEKSQSETASGRAVLSGSQIFAPSNRTHQLKESRFLPMRG